MNTNARKFPSPWIRCLAPLSLFIFINAASADGAEPCLCEDWREKHPEWIWCDDFEGSVAMKEKYFEYDSDDGDFIVAAGEGVNGSRGMRARFQQGEVSAGSFKKSFGRTPGGYIGRHSEKPDEDFNEIYWRFDLRRQAGWKGGGGAKLCRAMSFANEGWAQGMIAHLWSGGLENLYLVLDPASGIDADGNLKSTKYNDFPNLRWLGIKRGKTPLFNEENADQWFCVEAHVRLNTPGQSDGVFEYWINGELQASHQALNWHGDWNREPGRYKINALFFSNYWNSGSVQEQERYLDNLVISRERVGCDCADDDQPRADADFDGVPDDFEERFPAYAVGLDDDARDADLDGMTNAEEYRAGTLADDARSNLGIKRWDFADDRLQLEFHAVRDRRYRIEKSLVKGPFVWESGLSIEMDGGNADQIVQVPIGEGAGEVYRVRLESP